MAELLLQELGPQFISRPTEDVGYDLLVGFENKKGGINTFAVELKSTARPPGTRFQLLGRAVDRFAHSNIPGLLLVADVKQNRMYYAWLNQGKAPGSAHVSIPIIEVNETTRKDLESHLKSIEHCVAAAD